MEEVTTLFDSDEAEYEYMKEQEARRLKAEEEKQIEEMARQNCHIEYHMKNYKTCKECYETNYCACRVYEVCRNLYNAGYRKQSGWISVEERLPDSDCRCLVWSLDYVWLSRFASYNYGTERWYVVCGGQIKDTKRDGVKVTHWMPLPEPPKGAQ